MKKLSIRWSLLALVLAWSACEKVEIPDSTYTGIPFGIKGKVDGNDFDLGIHQKGVKMMTGAEFVTDSVWQFSGILGAGNGGAELQIQLRNRRIGQDTQIVDWPEYKDDSLVFQKEGGKLIQIHQLKVSVENSEELPIISIQCGDQRRVGNQNVQEFQLANRITTPIKVEYGKANKIGFFYAEVGHLAPVSNVTPNWFIKSSTNQSAQLVGRLSNSAVVDTYNWGNGSTAIEAINVTEAKEYQVDMKDKDGRLYMHKKRLLYNEADQIFFTYGNSFALRTEWMPAGTQLDKKQLRAVRITYKDENGHFYYSDLDLHDTNQFVIKEIKAFEKDGRGRPTLAIRVQFSVRLISRPTGAVINMENCSGWFAIGLP